MIAPISSTNLEKVLISSFIPTTHGTRRLKAIPRRLRSIKHRLALPRTTLFPSPSIKLRQAHHRESRRNRIMRHLRGPHQHTIHNKHRPAMRRQYNITGRSFQIQHYYPHLHPSAMIHRQQQTRRRRRATELLHGQMQIHSGPLTILPHQLISLFRMHSLHF